MIAHANADCSYVCNLWQGDCRLNCVNKTWSTRFKMLFGSCCIWELYWERNYVPKLHNLRLPQWYGPSTKQCNEYWICNNFFVIVYFISHNIWRMYFHIIICDTRTQSVKATKQNLFFKAQYKGKSRTSSISVCPRLSFTLFSQLH